MSIGQNLLDSLKILFCKSNTTMSMTAVAVEAEKYRQRRFLVSFAQGHKGLDFGILQLISITLV